MRFDNLSFDYIALATYDAAISAHALVLPEWIWKIPMKWCS